MADSDFGFASPPADATPMEGTFQGTAQPPAAANFFPREPSSLSCAIGHSPTGIIAALMDDRHTSHLGHRSPEPSHTHRSHPLFFFFHRSTGLPPLPTSPEHLAPSPSPPTYARASAYSNSCPAHRAHLATTGWTQPLGSHHSLQPTSSLHQSHH